MYQHYALSSDALTCALLDVLLVGTAVSGLVFLKRGVPGSR